MFEGLLCWGVLEEDKRVRQIVLVANVSEIRKPVLVALAEASENLDSDIVENVAI